MYVNGYCYVSPKAQAKLKELGVDVETFTYKKSPMDWYSDTAESFDIPDEHWRLFRYYGGDAANMGELYTEEEVREKRLDNSFRRIEQKACEFFGLDASTGELVDSGMMMTDGGSCTGHWYEYDYSVLGTAGNMAKKRSLTFSINDGYVMDGRHTGPLNENPVWECAGLPTDKSIGIFSLLKKFGLDRCSVAVFLPSYDCPVRDKHKAPGWVQNTFDGLVVFDKKDSDGKRFALGYVGDRIDFTLLSLDDNELRELYRDDVEQRRWNGEMDEKAAHILTLTGLYWSTGVHPDMTFVRDLVVSKARYYRDQSTRDPVDFVRARYAKKADYWEKILRGDTVDKWERSECGFGHKLTNADKYMKYRHMQESPSATAEEKAGYGQKMDYWADIARKDMEYDKVHHGLVVPERTDVVVDKPDAVFVGGHEVKKLGPDEEYDDASYSW